MANFCNKCGAPLQDGAKFCIRCGNVIGGNAYAQPVQNPAYQQMNQMQPRLIKKVIRA